MIDKNDTIAAIATPPGKGGIGVIRISGPAAPSIANSICAESLSARHATYCNFKDQGGTVLDTGIVLYFPAPASYTGEDVIELQGHGGQIVLNSILEQTIRLGARQAKPGEFTERAFHNNKIDLLQAEAVADLIDSSSNEAARSALRSLNGEFSARISTLLLGLTKIRVFIEGSLDFPEEEIDFLKVSDLRLRLEEGLNQINTILLEAQNGQVLREGIKITIAGPPNAGKSSLLNALSQTNRAIVSDSPGTTRDVVEDTIQISGTPINIVDTAGIRETRDEIEQEGINRARKAIDNADLVLLVREVQKDDQPTECLVSRQLPQGKRCIVVYNKIDLFDMPAQISEKKGSRPEVFLSAKTKEGIDKLKEEIGWLMGIGKNGEAVLAGRTRHIDALKKAAALFESATKKLKASQPALELVAEDLQQAQRWIESITGKSTADELLGEIFSSFCIGK